MNYNLKSHLPRNITQQYLTTLPISLVSSLLEWHKQCRIFDICIAKWSRFAPITTTMYTIGFPLIHHSHNTRHQRNDNNISAFLLVYHTNMLKYHRHPSNSNLHTAYYRPQMIPTPFTKSVSAHTTAGHIEHASIQGPNVGRKLLGIRIMLRLLIVSAAASRTSKGYHNQ